MKKIMIYGKTVFSAERYLHTVLKLTGADLNEISHIRLTIDRNGKIVKMSNGDLYQAITASQNCRGIKCTYAFIDLEIDQDLIYDVLLYTVINRDNVFFYR